MDEQATEEYGYNRGLEEGKINIIKSMLKNNIDINIIINCTDFTEEEILKIKNDNNL
jgi:predicted transposase/invertase (TIGR01784 family)